MTINLSTEKLIKFLQPILLVAILVLLVWSKPWQESSSVDTRKITVSGSATIKAEPDEYVFSPYFQASGKDETAVKEKLNKSANAAVEKLKKLGVEEKDIKLDSSSYDYWYYSESEEGTLTITLQITTMDKKKAQEIQDYLQTLDLEGQLSPTASFSDAMQKELDAQAVDKASQDAKSKAEQQAKLLGVKVGKVLEVSQGSDSMFPIAYDSISSSEGAEKRGSSIPVLPGENEYTQTVTVVYELK